MGNDNNILPVRSLQNRITSALNSVIHSSDYPGIETLYDTQQISRVINWVSLPKPIVDCAMIEGPNEEGQDEIYVYENYLQLLWCLCYSVLTMLPLFRKRLNGEDVDWSEPVHVLHVGVLLLKEYECTRYFQIPNPMNVSKEKAEIVETVNINFIACVVFVLMHELGHHYHSHTRTRIGDAKMQESDADEFALDQFKIFAANTGIDLDISVVIAAFSIAIVSGFDGGKSHQDPIPRLDEMLQKMNLDDDSYIWVLALFVLRLFYIHFCAWENIGIIEPDPPGVDSAKLGYEYFRDWLVQKAESQGWKLL